MAPAGVAIVACAPEPAAGTPPATSDASAIEAGAADAPAPHDPDASDAGVSDSGDAAAPFGGLPAGPFAMFVGIAPENRQSELTVVDLATGTYAGRFPSTSIDSVPFASGRRPFLLQRDLAQLLVMDSAAPWRVTRTVTLTGGSDVTAIAADEGTKAYVTRSTTNAVLVVDTATGAKMTEIDLTPYMLADDSDGTVGASGAAFDPATKRVYFLLDRIVSTALSAGDGSRACLPKGAVLVAFDTATDTVVDLNGASAGEALELQGSGPSTLVSDVANGRLLVAHTGCYDSNAPRDADAGTVVRRGKGVEAFNLTTGETSWLYRTTDYKSWGLLYAEVNHSFVMQEYDVYAWDSASTTLGALLPDGSASLPQAPVYDGRGHVIGLSRSDADPHDRTLLKVVSLDVRSLEQTTMTATEPFLSPRPTRGALLLRSAVTR